MPRSRVPRRLSRGFYARDALVVAPALLGKILQRTDPRSGLVTSGRIVEVEAYRGSDDPASHAFRGRTKRNAIMFGPAGHLYVYFSYGMHWCCNVVTGPNGRAQAVLIRALAPLDGIETMRVRRHPASARGDRELCSGPAKLTAALGITADDHGVDVVASNESSSSAVELLDDGTRVPSESIEVSLRVGISVGTELPYRYFIAADKNVSRLPASSRRPSSG